MAQKFSWIIAISMDIVIMSLLVHLYYLLWRSKRGQLLFVGIGFPTRLFDGVHQYNVVKFLFCLFDMNIERQGASVGYDTGFVI